MSRQAAMAGPGPPVRLLVADGDPSLRRVLHLALQARGYQVTLAATATTALEMAVDEHPDVILLDLGLAGVVDTIRALRQAAATSILLLTWPTEPDRQAALDAGAHDTLTKPFGIDQLLVRLERLQAAAAIVPPVLGHPQLAPPVQCSPETRIPGC
jgi:two-component system, OmpR family, KDP operon response regulator KdpE